MSNGIIEDPQKKKNFKKMVAATAVGAALVPVFTRAVKPLVTRVVVPALGPVGGTIANVAIMVIIPPIASVVGNVIVEKGPRTVRAVSDFGKGVSRRMSDKNQERKAEQEETRQASVRLKTLLEKHEAGLSNRNLNTQIQPTEKQDAISDALHSKLNEHAVDIDSQDVSTTTEKRITQAIKNISLDD